MCTNTFHKLPLMAKCGKFIEGCAVLCRNGARGAQVKERHCIGSRSLHVKSKDAVLRVPQKPKI